MKRRRLFALLLAVTFGVGEVEAGRIKDIASIEGVRENQLIGYGLVVGLDRTGDQVIGGQFTIQAIMSMLNKMGINLVIDPIQLLTRNTASVIVTSKLPPFAKPGMTLDAVASSMANAKSLQGGTLLMTPLKAPNQQVYAVAQGPISTAGFFGGGSGGLGGGGGAAGQGSSTVSKNHQSAGVVPGGAIVEKEVATDIEGWDHLNLMLLHADFTTAIRMAEAIDGVFGPGTAVALNSGTVRTNVPASFQGRLVQYVATVEGLDVPVDVPAKVVVNERTGTVVLGEHVRLGTCAISHGNLTISVKVSPQVSQPNAAFFGSSLGETKVTDDVNTQVQEQQSRLVVVDETVTLGEVVRALNAVGVTPRDLVAILTAIKAAGALHATLETI